MIGDFRRNSHRRYPNLKITVTAPSYNYTAIWWFVRFFRRSKADHRICKQTDNIRRSRSAYSNLLMTLPRRISDYLLNHCKIRVLFYYFAEKKYMWQQYQQKYYVKFCFFLENHLYISSCFLANKILKNPIQYLRVSISSYLSPERPKRSKKSWRWGGSAGLLYRSLISDLDLRIGLSRLYRKHFWRLKLAGGWGRPGESCGGGG